MLRRTDKPDLELTSIFKLKNLFYLILLIILSCGGDLQIKQINTPSGIRVELYWDAPTTYNDGTAIPQTELLAYKVYYGSVSRMYTNVIDVGQVLTHDVSNNPDGTYYAVTAYMLSNGIESDFSNEVMK